MSRTVRQALLFADMQPCAPRMTHLSKAHSRLLMRS